MFPPLEKKHSSHSKYSESKQRTFTTLEFLETNQDAMHSAPVEMGDRSAESRFTTNIPSPSGPVRDLHRGGGGEMKMHVSDFVMHYLIS